MPHLLHLKQDLCHTSPRAGNFSLAYTVLVHPAHLSAPPAAFVGLAVGFAAAEVDVFEGLGGVFAGLAVDVVVFAVGFAAAVVDVVFEVLVCVVAVVVVVVGFAAAVAVGFGAAAAVGFGAAVAVGFGAAAAVGFAAAAAVGFAADAVVEAVFGADFSASIFFLISSTSARIAASSFRMAWVSATN